MASSIEYFDPASMTHAGSYGLGFTGRRHAKVRRIELPSVADGGRFPR